MNKTTFIGPSTRDHDARGLAICPSRSAGRHTTRSHESFLDSNQCWGWYLAVLVVEGVGDS